MFLYEYNKCNCIYYLECQRSYFYKQNTVWKSLAYKRESRRHTLMQQFTDPKH